MGISCNCNEPARPVKERQYPVDKEEYLPQRRYTMKNWNNMVDAVEEITGKEDVARLGGLEHVAFNGVTRDQVKRILVLIKNKFNKMGIRVTISEPMFHRAEGEFCLSITCHDKSAAKPTINYNLTQRQIDSITTYQPLVK